jgi:photosynthetic reaction center H subunit
MYNQYFAGTIDITEMVLYLFFAFFLCLVIYLQNESTREGFPIEDDVTGKLETNNGFFFRAVDPKDYLMSDGTVLKKPDGVRDTQDISFRRTAAWPGSPIEPTGNPLTAGVGPGSYALRANVPDVTSHGDVRIAPLRVSPDYYTDPKDAQLVGMTLVGNDKKPGGTITDVWVDRAEFLIRYLEVATINADGTTTGKTVLVPMTMCAVKKATNTVHLDAVNGHQVAGAPQLANPNQITLLEEEKCVGYFGAGYLYATKELAEPLL